MEIILAAQISGTRNGKDWPPAGTRLELPDDEAQSLINNGTAFDVDDERVQHLGNGNGGAPMSDEMLAGAPTARDWTEGQQDTNLARARAVALAGEDGRELTRAAAERAGLTDELTVAGRSGTSPVVGDDSPNPTDGDPANDGARLIESAALSPSGETATVDRSARKARRTPAPAAEGDTSTT